MYAFQASARSTSRIVGGTGRPRHAMIIFRQASPQTLFDQYSYCSGVRAPELAQRGSSAGRSEPSTNRGTSSADSHCE
jgi:hypothetical protein